MKKSTKIWLITATILFLAGAIIFIGALFSMNFDFKRLDTRKFNEQVYLVTEDFDDIFIDFTTEDIELYTSDDEVCKVVCYEDEKMNSTVTVEEGVLKIIQKDKRKWYEYINLFSFKEAKTKVYLPSDSYKSLKIDITTGDITIPKDFKFYDINILGRTCDVKSSASAVNTLKIKLTTGDVNLSGLSGKNIDVSSTTGDVEFKNLKAEKIINSIGTGDAKFSDIICAELSTKGTTGDISLNNVISSGKLFAKRTTGDIEFDNSDADELEIKITTGDVSGRLLSSKIFEVKTTTGDIDVPKTNSGGKCKITTTTGDVEIKIKE